MSIYINAYEYFRRRAGMSQIEVSKALGIAQGTVSTWENGRANPTAERLVELSKLYGCTVDDLLKKGVYKLVREE